MYKKFASVAIAMFAMFFGGAPRAVACGTPTPTVSAKLVFTVGKTPVIKINIRNNNSIPETMTAVADVFTVNGTHQLHLYSSPMQFQAGEQRQFSFEHNLTGLGGHFIQVGVYNDVGCQLYNQKLINFNLTPNVQTCPGNCNFQ